MKAIFKEVVKGKNDLSSDDSDASDEDYASDEDFASYTAPLNDLYSRSSSPGAEGNERGMYDRMKRRLRRFYDPSSDDEELSKCDKERYRRLPPKTPKYRGQRAPMQYDLLKHSEENPELSVEEFAIGQNEKRLDDLAKEAMKPCKKLSREQKIKRLIRIYGQKIPRKKPCRKRLHLRL